MLTPAQLGLSAKLKSLASLTSRYWRAVATAPQTLTSPGEWEAETIPWRTGDGQASIYWNAFLARLVMSGGSLNGSDLQRFASLAERLGEAGRVTAPPYPPDADPAISSVHYPGLQIDLNDDAGNKAFRWFAYDFPCQLLKLSSQVLVEVEDPNIQERMQTLNERIWQHLKQRTSSGVGNSWDFFDDVFKKYDFFGEHAENIDIESVNRKRKAVGLPKKGDQVNSWYMTERATEALVAAAEAETNVSAPSPELRRLAIQLSREVQATIARSALSHEDARSGRSDLETARKLIGENPGQAVARLLKLLRDYG